METTKMLSTSEVSRITLTPLSKVLRAIHRGALIPDVVALDDRLFLFNPERVPTIKAQLSKAEI
jgi:hypothetical protein